jgi:hypothetical protein
VASAETQYLPRRGPWPRPLLLRNVSGCPCHNCGQPRAERAAGCMPWRRIVTSPSGIVRLDDGGDQAGPSRNLDELALSQGRSCRPTAPFADLVGLSPTSLCRGNARRAPAASRSLICVSAPLADKVENFQGRPVVPAGNTEALRVFAALRPDQYDSPATRSYLDAFARTQSQ